MELTSTRFSDLKAPMLETPPDSPHGDSSSRDSSGRGRERNARARSHTLPERIAEFFDDDEDEEHEVGDEDPDVACKLLMDNEFRKRVKRMPVSHSSMSLGEMGEDKPDQEDPQYPEGGDPPGEATTGATVMTFLKCFLGTGVLFLPDGFHKAGIIPAALMLLGSGWLATHCMKLLLETKKTLQRNTGITPQSYGQIAEMSFGKRGKRMVDSAIIASQCGFCAVYVGFVGSNMSKVYSFGLGQKSWSAHVIWMTVAQLFFSVLVWVRKLSLFATTNAISVCIIFASIGIIFGGALYQTNSQGVSDSAHWGINSQILTFFGTAVYSYEGIALVLPIEREMKDRSQVVPVIHGAMALLVALFVMIGTLSYLAFGDDTKVIVLQNLKNLSDKPSWSAFEKCVLVAYCFAIIFTYPLQLVPPCRISERKLFEQRDGDEEHDHALKWRKNAWRTALTFIIFFVAAGTSTQLDNLVAIIGALACVPLAYIFPALFHMVTCDPDSRSDKAIIIFGILGAIMSFIAAIASWADEPLDV